MITGKNYIGEELSSKGEVTFKTFDPKENKETAAIFYEATPDEVDAAVEKAAAAFKVYKQKPDADKAEFLEAIAEASIIVIAPSNPFLSIDPILSISGVRAALEASKAPRVAISPIVEGSAIKGPAARMLESLGHEVSAVGVARIYADLVDWFFLDELDRDLEKPIKELGLNTHVTNTIMNSDSIKRSLASEVIKVAGL